MICPICEADIKISYYKAHQSTQKHMASVASGQPSEVKSTKTRLEYFKEKNAQKKTALAKKYTPEQIREKARITRQKNRLALKAKLAEEEDDEENEDEGKEAKESKEDQKESNKHIETFLKSLRHDLVTGVKENKQFQAIVCFL